MQLTALKLNYEKTDNTKIISHTAIWGEPSLGKHNFEGLNSLPAYRTFDTDYN